MSHLFVKLRNKELPNAWCIMATAHANSRVFVYWTNIDKMDDKSDKSEWLSQQDFELKYKPLEKQTFEA